MALFYGKNHWLDKLTGEAETSQPTPPPTLFKKKRSPIAQSGLGGMPVESVIDEPGLATEPVESRIPNYQKRMAEDSHLPRGLFSNAGRTSRMTSGFDSTPDVDESMSQDGPSLFGKKEKPEKIGFLKNLGISFIDRILPGFAKRSVGEDEEKSSSQKDFEYYSGLPEDKQSKYREMKAASALVTQPFQQKKFDIDQGNKRRDDEMAFRKEYSNNPVVKEFNEANLGINKIRQAANSPDKTGFNDQALIFNFMKVLDPGSVVREGEYASATKNASVFDQMGIKIDRALSGEQLSEEQRRKLMQAAELQFKANQDRFSRYKSSMSKIAQDSLLDPTKVMPQFEETEDKYSDVKKFIKENPDDPRSAAALKKLISLGVL
jgi:hypothetical protein